MLERTMRLFGRIFPNVLFTQPNKTELISAYGTSFNWKIQNSENSNKNMLFTRPVSNKEQRYSLIIVEH